MISCQMPQASSNSICESVAISRLSHKCRRKEARQGKTHEARKGACEFLCPAWRMQPHLAGCLVSQKHWCVQVWHAKVASSAVLYGLWLPPQHRLACQLRFFISRERGASPHIWTSHFLCSPHRLLWVHEEEAQYFLHRWGALDLRCSPHQKLILAAPLFFTCVRVRLCPQSSVRLLSNACGLTCV